MKSGFKTSHGCMGASWRCPNSRLRATRGGPCHLAAALGMLLLVLIGVAAVICPSGPWGQLGHSDAGPGHSSAVLAQLPGDPVAEAGPDQTVTVGSIVVLNGSGSTDDGQVVNYTWTFTDGDPQILYGEVVTYVFLREAMIEVTLNITDDEGNHGTDVTVVTVTYVTPTADAGPDLIVYQGSTVTLSGIRSAGGIVGYTWAFMYEGEEIVLDGVVMSYTFLVVGLYNVTLTVIDYTDQVATDEAVVDVRAIVAEAGGNQTIYDGQTATFNGGKSLGNDLEFTWTFVYRDDGVILYGWNASYVFEVSGTYIVTLTVRNPANITATDTMTLTVMSHPTWLESNWQKLVLSSLIVGAAGLYLFMKYRRDRAIITQTEKDKMRLQWKNARKTWRSFVSNSKGLAGLTILAVFIVMALVAEPLYALGLIQNPSNVIESSTGDPLESPSWSYLLGTDEKGRDVLSELFFGSRTSLIVGFAAAILTILLGATVGLAAGASGRAVDEVLMRLTDVFLVIPWLPFAVILASFLPPLNQPSMYKIIIVIGVTSWPAAARIVRSQVLSIRERSFIERAVAVGAGRFYVMRKHLLPNVFPLVFANAILSVSYAILSEAFLAFFGISDVTKVTWGSMLYNAFNFGGFTANAWWYVLAPGVCIVLVVLGFTFVSYALDDILNPKLRKR